MSLHYLLDGYNIIPQMPVSISASLEAQRQALVRFVETQRPQGSLKNRVTIVFDGKIDVWGGMESAVIKVIFSKNGTADEKIKQIVEESSRKKNFVIVTDDRAIQYAVKALGAKVVSVGDFLESARGSKSSPSMIKRNGQKQQNKKISKAVEHKITSEMEEIWLRKSTSQQEKLT